MAPQLIWRITPDARVYQVFDRRRRSLGAWTDEDTARAILALHPGGYLLAVDEYRAKMPHPWHVKRVVVSEAR